MFRGGGKCQAVPAPFICIDSNLSERERERAECHLHADERRP